MNEKKIKVAHFIWWIPHYRVSIFRRLSQNPNLDFRIYAGTNTQVIGGTKIASAEETGRIEGINWYPLKKSLRIGFPKKIFEWQPEAIKIACREKYDAVICFGGRSLSNIFVKIICRIRGIPLIEWGMGIRGPESGIKWFLKAQRAKLAHAHLIYGKFASDWYKTHGFKEDSVFTVRNSLDYEYQVKIKSEITREKITEIRERFRCVSHGDRLVFCSSRLENNKDLHLLIQAVKILKEKQRNVKALLIGSGDLKQTLVELAQKEQVQDRLIFWGPCYDERILGEMISACELCVVPGALGLTAMHSMVYGIPVLTRENTSYLHGPEVEAVIENKTGGFYRHGDVAHLAQRIEEMLYPEPAKNRMSENCMKMIQENFTPAYQERVIIQCLNYVLPDEKKIPVP